MISKHFRASGETRFRLVPPPSSVVFRIARDPFVPPPWEYARNDLLPKTFGGRFDDPSGRWGVPVEERFRTLYCTTQRTGAFAETIDPLRVKLPEFLQRVRDFVTDSGDDEAFRQFRRAVIPREWLDKKRIGSTLLDSDLRFVDLEAAETLQTLNLVPRLMRLAARLGLDQIDRRVLVLRGDQMRLSQEIAYWASQQVDHTGAPVAGVRYVSRLGGEWECWALFDVRVAGRHRPGYIGPIDPSDPDLIEVARGFDLDIEVVRNT
jgi:hypothetical protein